VNTPLGLAHHAASLIEETLSGLDAADLPPAAVEALDTVARAAEVLRGNAARAADLIKTFKHLSGAHADGTVETIGLTDFVSEVVRMFDLQARAALLTVGVHSELRPDQERWTGPSGHLSQVLLNLLSNVQRYAYDPAVGGPVEVRLTCDADTSAYRLAVVDHGRGVEPAVRDNVFDAFVTVGRGSGGSGLGLAIAYNLCATSLGGGIALTDTDGGGTTMTVTFSSQPTHHPA
jgi:signal transduction histidine kinase